MKTSAERPAHCVSGGVNSFMKPMNGQLVALHHFEILGDADRRIAAAAPAASLKICARAP